LNKGSGLLERLQQAHFFQIADKRFFNESRQPGFQHIRGHRRVQEMRGCDEHTVDHAVQ